MEAGHDADHIVADSKKQGIRETGQPDPLDIVKDDWKAQRIAAQPRQLFVQRSQGSGLASCQPLPSKLPHGPPAAHRIRRRRLPRHIEQRLTAEDAELTPTMKLKRSLIKRK